MTDTYRVSLSDMMVAERRRREQSLVLVGCAEAGNI
jgi:hypothetical protein